VASVNSVKRNGHRLLESIGVNDAGVAGVATPQYFDVFYFFPFSGTSEYRKSLSFSSAMRPV